MEAALRAEPPPAATDDVPPRPASFTARSRPLGLVTWSPDIVGRTLLGALGSDASVDLGGEPGVRVDDGGLRVATGLITYDFTWDEVEGVYAHTTTDADLPFVLVVQTTDAAVLVLVDLDLGADAEAAAAAAQRYVVARRDAGG